MGVRENSVLEGHGKRIVQGNRHEMQMGEENDGKKVKNGQDVAWHPRAVPLPQSVGTGTLPLSAMTSIRTTRAAPSSVAVVVGATSASGAVGTGTGAASPPGAQVKAGS